MYNFYYSLIYNNKKNNFVTITYNLFLFKDLIRYFSRNKKVTIVTIVFIFIYLQHNTVKTLRNIALHLRDRRNRLWKRSSYHTPIDSKSLTARTIYSVGKSTLTVHE